MPGFIITGSAHHIIDTNKDPHVPFQQHTGMGLRLRCGLTQLSHQKFILESKCGQAVRNMKIPPKNHPLLLISNQMKIKYIHHSFNYVYWLLMYVLLLSDMNIQPIWTHYFPSLLIYENILFWLVRHLHFLHFQQVFCHYHCTRPLFSYPFASTKPVQTMGFTFFYNWFLPQGSWGGAGAVQRMNGLISPPGAIRQEH